MRENQIRHEFASGFMSKITAGWLGGRQRNARTRGLGCRVAILTFVVSFGTSIPASADLTIYAEEISGDVRFSYGGVGTGLDISGLGAGIIVSSGSPVRLVPGDPSLTFAPGSPVDFYNVTSLTGFGDFTPTSGGVLVGDPVGFHSSFGIVMMLPDGYSSGTPFTESTITWSGTTFAGMGITMADTTVVDWGGASSDTEINLVFGPPPSSGPGAVPEPTTFLALLGLGGGLLFRRQRRRLLSR